MPQLLANRGWTLGERDPHLVEQAAADALLALWKTPHAYDPSRSTLLGYLRLIARRRLINAWEREKHHRTNVSLEPVELFGAPRNTAQGETALPNDLSVRAVMEGLDALLPDARDRKAVRMVIDGVRSTTEYAQVYGLTGLPMTEQQTVIKKHKDRLTKVMRRLGARLRDGA